jgi:hypothetical protein
MPGKMARSAPRSPFGLAEVRVAVRTSRMSSRQAGKARIFMPVRESFGESRFKSGTLAALRTLVIGGLVAKPCYPVMVYLFDMNSNSKRASAPAPGVIK